MKQLAQIGLNYSKSLKSSLEDENEEKVYAEVNLILHEPEYVIEGSSIRKKGKITEVEFNVAKKDAKMFAKAFNDIYKKINEKKKRETLQ